MLIYKILRKDEWAAFEAAGETQGAPVDLADGYIHFSTAETVAATAAKYFAGEADLWLLAIESDTVADALKWEPARDTLFPHLYRNLLLTEVTWAVPLPLDGNGHIFPALT